MRMSDQLGETNRAACGSAWLAAIAALYRLICCPAADAARDPDDPAAIAGLVARLARADWRRRLCLLAELRARPRPGAQRPAGGRG